jgi:hypothetical protein
MSFQETDNYAWTNLMRSIHNIMTAKAGAVCWTEAELSRAVGAMIVAPMDFEYVDDDEILTSLDVTDALSSLFLSGHIISAFPCEGWRRA